MSDAEDDLLSGFEKLDRLPAEQRLLTYKRISDSLRYLSIAECNPIESLAHLDDQLIVTADGHVDRRPPHVFLSHSHADKPFVRNLARELGDKGLNVWVDEAELNYGDSLILRLCDAIDRVDVMVAVLSNSSIASTWVQKEIEIAMTQEINLKRVKVIPLLIHRIAVPAFLEGKVYADFTTRRRRKTNLPKLIDSIRHHGDAA